MQPEKKKPKLSSIASCKVFISGLPFDITNKELRAYFKSKCYDEDADKESSGGKFIRYCKLLTFTDSKRCNGQAEIIFQTEEITNKALDLHGEVLERGIDADVEKESDEKPKKNLTLSIKKAVATKKKDFRKKKLL